MSMISKFVAKLKLYASEYNELPYGREVEGTGDLLKEAADIIEELSAKLASVNNERSERYYKDVPDTNVWKNLSENLIEKFKDGAFRVKTSDLSFINLERAIGIVNQLAEEYKDIPDTNVGKWIPVSERLPENTDPVNITWVNHEPEPYYADIKDKPFTATGCYCDGKWYWYSAVCQAYLDEYRYSENDYMDNGIEVMAWQPLPEPYKGE